MKIFKEIKRAGNSSFVAFVKNMNKGKKCSEGEFDKTHPAAGSYAYPCHGLHYIVQGLFDLRLAKLSGSSFPE